MQSVRPVRRVAELGSLGGIAHFMATKTYKIQVVWNDVGGTLAHVDAKMEWDRDDSQAVPRLLCEDGTKVVIEKTRLKEIGNDGPDFVYESPGFVQPTSH